MEQAKATYQEVSLRGVFTTEQDAHSHMNILIEGSISEWQIILPENLTIILEELRKDIERDIRNFDTLEELNITFKLVDDPMSREAFAHEKRGEKLNEDEIHKLYNHKLLKSAKAAIESVLHGVKRRGELSKKIIAGLMTSKEH